MAYPRCRKVPSPPSMYVIDERVPAVLANPGSYVTVLSEPRSLEISRASLPRVPVSTLRSRLSSPTKILAEVPGSSVIARLLSSRGCAVRDSADRPMPRL